MVRYKIESEFREELFQKAVKMEGGETHLGRKLGYKINFGFRVRQLRRGEVSISERQLKELSSITKIRLQEIQQHSTEQKTSRSKTTFN